ncbi:uncharacterized protein MYCFIDRAFT_172883 [Pseudocercospora fijiensis CIRAD86]|uniref:Uncharacterized protein n=1 Tax=Pseudocercospora fijiensis (strain CIRAD86) TaxID=383855 RepID=M2ZXY4_PSEFD|nr:uncharacterized protein MYCFIDRAFT_172883 [Pseudocercospora fijiensis CIRAD86]EME83804.1 hypothetical protein MYCFIDRAFT_172883 [Pseudocercospora fijiensis CIRAD86]
MVMEISDPPSALFASSLPFRGAFDFFRDEVAVAGGDVADDGLHELPFLPLSIDSCNIAFHSSFFHEEKLRPGVCFMILSSSRHGPPSVEGAGYLKTSTRPRPRKAFAAPHSAGFCNGEARRCQWNSGQSVVVSVSHLVRELSIEYRKVQYQHDLRD